MYLGWEWMCIYHILIQTKDKNLRKIHLTMNLLSYCYDQVFYQNIIPSAQLKLMKRLWMICYVE